MGCEEGQMCECNYSVCTQRICTHTCSLLHTLQQVFGGDEEVQHTVESVTLVTFLNGAKQLAEDGGSGGLERWEQGRQRALDGRVQGFWVLEDKKSARS